MQLFFSAKRLRNPTLEGTSEQGRILGFFPESVLSAFSRPEGVQTFNHIFRGDAHSNSNIPPEISNLRENVSKHYKPP